MLKTVIWPCLLCLFDIIDKVLKQFYHAYIDLQLIATVDNFIELISIAIMHTS